MDPCINLIHDSIHATNLKIQTPFIKPCIHHAWVDESTNQYISYFIIQKKSSSPKHTHKIINSTTTRD